MPGPGPTSDRHPTMLGHLGSFPANHRRVRGLQGVPSRLGHVHAYQTISSRALSAMLKNQKYADVSPIADATMETTYRLAKMMLAPPFDNNRAERDPGRALCRSAHRCPFSSRAGTARPRRRTA